jgi:hypothetical protein
VETFDLGTIREKAHSLKWRDGLDRGGIRRQWHNMPSTIYDVLPVDYVFHNEGEVMSYFEHLLRHGALQNLRDTGDDPRTYKDSSEEFLRIPSKHGVGSGADPGYTGGGSVQTGVGREGTTYGDEE